MKHGLWSDKVVDKYGNEIGEIRRRLFGKEIVDKDGKKLADYRDDD